ncbi:hypothetical protein [Micromonospora fulviviridis]|uniref:Uncharacterized protein n=1 Tax=Micromonospora fulviviridis TaxID=47860 RepID=A0ABV2VWD6_9ACTN
MSFRYYVSFSFQSPSGMGIAAIDFTISKRIEGASEIALIRQDLANKGYAKPTVLAFSLYSEPRANNGNRRR